MGFEISPPAIGTGNFSITVPMKNRVIDACAIPIGWQGVPYTSDGLPALEVTFSNQSVVVTGGDSESCGTITFVVVAQTLDALSPVEVIRVQWGKTGLSVDRPDPILTRPCTITWIAEEDEEGNEFNIIGVLGLPPVDFSPPVSYKKEQGQPLSWRVRDHLTSAGTFYYSLIAQRNNEVRYLDPKITNKPSLLGQTSAGSA